MEQLHRSVSKFSRGGANPSFIEQNQPRWSKSIVHRANPAAVEQLQRSVSKSSRGGATSTFSEQIQPRWSNFIVQ